MANKLLSNCFRSWCNFFISDTSDSSVYSSTVHQRSERPVQAEEGPLLLVQGCVVSPHPQGEGSRGSGLGSVFRLISQGIPALNHFIPYITLCTILCHIYNLHCGLVVKILVGASKHVFFIFVFIQTFQYHEMHCEAVIFVSKYNILRALRCVHVKVCTSYLQVALCVCVIL